ncbi:krueppel protein [Sporodiniella umbellata]|nr:krueppel protein [Sporodiniella umbellata]
MNQPPEHLHSSQLIYFLNGTNQDLFSPPVNLDILQEYCRLYYASSQPTEHVRCRWSSCLESFSQPEDLAPHVVKDHVNKMRQKQLRCYWESCSEIVEDLLSHLTSCHRMRLWVACRWQDCKRRFEGFQPLTDHVSKEHVGNGQSEYECGWTHCLRVQPFIQRQKMMRHIQTHIGARPYQCDVCLKRFSEASLMTQHQRVHTGERPYRCQECTKTFSLAASLTIHKRIHTGEKPFTCKFQNCQRRFIESSNLTKHF